jgi:hypothetical protein
MAAALTAPVQLIEPRWSPLCGRIGMPRWPSWRRIARYVAAWLLYAWVGFGAWSCLTLLIVSRNSIARNSATGDYAGAAMTVSFLVLFLLPSMLVALWAALWLLPPRWRRGSPRAGIVESPSPRRRIVQMGLVVGGSLVVAVATLQCIEPARRSIEHDSPERILARMTLAAMAFTWPVLYLLILILWSCWVLWTRSAGRHHSR